MAILHQPAPDAAPGARHRSGDRLRRTLLACGLVSSLLWPLASEMSAVLLWPGYSSFSQTISELTSVGAPTRPPMLVEGALYSALLVAFGIGVWQSARANRALRVTGALLLAYGAVGPLWYPFPMTARGDIAPTTDLTDVMHIVLGVVDTVLMLSILGFGAAALGRHFRIYSLLTVAAMLAGGASTFAFVPRVAAGASTPWLGVLERTYLGAFLLWVTVLAIALLRSPAAPPAPADTRRPAASRDWEPPLDGGAQRSHRGRN